jgi:hypothetical protein
MSALSNVKKVVLPDNMAYLTFTTADIADTVEELEIKNTNAKFKTIDGVLYSKEGENVKVLLIYPKAKTVSDDSFTVPSGVTEIGYRAFYGTKNLEILIINDVVTVRDQAFEATEISTISFTNNTASVFAGRNILLNANTWLVINVPVASVEAYKMNVLVDYSIVAKIIGA